MRLILRERQDLEHPEVIIEYRELTDGVKRVSAFIRSVDQSISCKKRRQRVLHSAKRCVLHRKCR